MEHFDVEWLASECLICNTVDISCALHSSYSRHLLQQIFDDATYGRFRYCATSTQLPRRLELAAPPVPITDTDLATVRMVTKVSALRAGMNNDRMLNLVRAVGECSANAVLHAGGGIGIVYTGGDGIVQVWITDCGPGIPVALLPKAVLQPGYSSAGSLGYGLWMAVNSVDRMWMYTGDSGTTVVIEQRCHDLGAPDPRSAAGEDS